ncbi:unnamed protein product, partial [marine sediment metagenome]
FLKIEILSFTNSIGILLVFWRYKLLPRKS